ncbi:YbaB/EbfC family nucleoid-associated protein [Dactylosporangium aurantiacum]|uniref:YbaB/EbfC family nucleoid-associated protein n=1 Tax=Dactylosporangium aurantiacum TaxID=35754 RepID=A0A9Q9IFE6_9ACTN|nr:YbaB/EbfC family nucleoid-associated protein [Dactylosporangium aurantiacum]MDG6100696.1 YbaB/EbfC family nucleoid-associated protein [Dactylosporangium aurantiacum]UWZ55229.1 YbaB/EbfC family nucleoid-associated protein [Dactylosporangium aurantiacum]
MGREIDERWIEQAVERYRRIDALLAEFDKAVTTVEVSVRSPDGLVEVVVTADGTIRDVRIDQLRGQTGAEVSRSVRAAVTAATDAAAWARKKLHAETFGDYRSLT